MNKQFEMVKEFHAAFGVEMPDAPTYLKGGMHDIPMAERLETECSRMKDISGSPVLTRASWMLEELIEFMGSSNLADQADALGDLIYFAIGTYTLMGLKPENIFNEIHAANMRKVVDGKVLRNKQGKIVKPDGWYGPEAEIRKEIERQNEPSNG